MNEFIASHNVLLLSISLVWVVAFVFFCIEMDQLDLALKARLGVLQAPHHNPGAWAGAAGVSVT